MVLRHEHIGWPNISNPSEVRRMFGFADANNGEGAPLQSSPGALT